MIIGVLSDTHGNLPLMLNAADWLAEKMDVELFCHLGDDYADGEALEAAGWRVIKVPGLWCPEYARPRIPKRQTLEVEGIHLSMAHAAKDLRAADYAADIVLLGHTHEAGVEQEPGRILMNPGHLKKPRDRGHAASFGLLRIQPEAIEAIIFEVNGEVRTRVCVGRGTNTGLKRT